MLLKGKIALVTGGSSGIGQSIATALASAGCQVIITYNTHQTNNPQFTEFKVDLHSETDIKNLFTSIQKQFGKLDILVNSAGVNNGDDPFNLDDWQDIFQVDLFAVVSCVGKAIKLMPGGGKVLNISSVWAEDKAAWAGRAAYCAAKAGVNNFTRTMAKQLAPKILVNAIAPGYTITPIWDKEPKEITDESPKELLIQRFIQPEEIASMALELIKNDAITGEVVVIDGGLSLKSI